MESTTPSGPRRPIFLPDMAQLVRPVWFATWVAEVYGALAVLPILLPVYGDPLPGWLWIGIGVQGLAYLGVAAFLDIRHRKGVYAWCMAAMATTGTSVIITIGMYILLTYQPTIWETIGLAVFGVFCLAFLVLLDRSGFSMEPSGAIGDSRKPIR